MRGVVRYLTVVVLLLLIGGEASAQWKKERGWVRKGNRLFEKGYFDQSVESYERALQYDSTSFEAKYDLASALYKNKRYDKAESTLMALLSDTTRTELERGEVAYNLGNTQFEQQKYQEALSSYRFAMRCNPDDEDAKHNYFLTKLMLKQQEQQNQDNKDNKDNKDDKQDQNQDQNQNNQGGNDQQDKNKQENKDDKNKQDKDDQQQPQDQKGDKEKQKSDQRPEGGMSPKQQEAILQAIQAQEDKTQDKVKEKAGVVIVGGKNW